MVDVQTDVYNHRYFAKRLQPRRQHTYDALAEEICSRISFHTFVDIGCATGDLIKRLFTCGKSGWGVELASAAFDLMPQSMRDLVICADATDPDLPRRIGRHDLAICLEVAEHLPPERSELLVSNLCNLAPIILFSAAPPGQKGTGHVNEREWQEWEALFAHFLYLDDIHTSGEIRNSLHLKRASAWYAHNVHLLRCYQHSAGGEE